MYSSRYIKNGVYCARDLSIRASIYKSGLYCNVNVIPTGEGLLTFFRFFFLLFYTGTSRFLFLLSFVRFFSPGPMMNGGTDRALYTIWPPPTANIRRDEREERKKKSPIRDFNMPQ